MLNDIFSVTFKHRVGGVLNVFLFITGRNVANPTALLLAAAKMLEHLGMQDKGLQVKTAVNNVLEEHQVKTRDLGGFATTSQFTQAVVDHL